MSAQPNRYVAIIPAKRRSSRVPDKNFREFWNGKSLLEIKLEQCRSSRFISEIYVSSDNDDIRPMVEGFGATFLPRTDYLSGDDAPWWRVLCGVLEQAPVDDDAYVAWTPVTNPLFARIDAPIELLEQDAAIDSVMTVTRLQHYYLNKDFIPLNHQWGVWASYSQKLDPIYQMNCAMWLARKGAMIRNRFQMGDAPGFLNLDAIEGIDIDTPEEFELAQFLYQRRRA